MPITIPNTGYDAPFTLELSVKEMLDPAKVDSVCKYFKQLSEQLITQGFISAPLTPSGESQILFTLNKEI
jgi:hypothetical protein